MARSPCPHSHRPAGPAGWRPGGEGAELDVVGAGQVTGGVLAVLADVEHGGRSICRRDERGGRGRLPGGRPGRHAAGELPGEVVVADLEGLPDDLAAVLVGVGDDDDRGVRVGTSQPSQVANAARSGIDSEPGMCPAAKSRPGARRRPGRPPARSGGPAARQRGEAGAAADHGRAAPVDLAQPGEVGAGRCPSWPAASRRRRPRRRRRAAGWSPARARSWWSGRRRAGRSRTNRRRGSATPASASGRAASRRSEAYWARASGSVRSGPTRSVRAAEPTISDPPVNTPSSCAAVEQQVGQVLRGVPGRGQGAQGQPAQVDLVAVGEPPVGERPAAGRGGEDCAPSSAASCGAPDRKSACRWVSAANAIRSPRLRPPPGPRAGPAAGRPPAPARRPDRPGRRSCPGPRRPRARSASRTR